MIDHLLVFADDAAREAVFPAPEDNTAPCWTADGRDIMPTSVIYDRATYDAEGNVISPQITAPGSWLAIRTTGPDPEIEAMAECVIVTNGVLAKQGQRYVIKCSLAPDTILGQVDPVWAGDGYAIPVGQPASVLDEWLVGG